MVIKSSDLIQQIIKIGNEFVHTRKVYTNAHPTFSEEKDARITIFGKCISLFDVSLLYFMFRTFQLPSDEWWSSLPGEFTKIELSPGLIKTTDELNRIKIMTAVDNYWGYSLFILLFGSLESSVRAIVRVVYPGKFNDGRADIKQIYQGLLSAKFSKYECLLELFRLCRNTSHNNGVYFPDTRGDDRQVLYQESTYVFIDGKPVELGDVPRLLFFDMIPELLKMINDIVNAEDVSKHDEIVDPSAH